MPGRDRRGGDEAGEVRPAVAERAAEAGPDREEGGVERHHRGDVEAAERDRRGLDADAQVVVAVDHRVLGVVGEHPEQVADQQPPGERRHGAGERRERPRIAAAHRGEGHRDAEAEGDAEDRLRHREEALGERIDQRHRQRGDAPQRSRRGWSSAPARRRGAPAPRRAPAPRATPTAPLVTGRCAVRLTWRSKSRSATSLAAQPALRMRNVPATKTSSRCQPGKAVGGDPERRQRRPEQQQLPAGRSQRIRSR